MLFIDRIDAGRRLARILSHLRGQDVVVLGLPRGGVPVAFEVAAALGAPLDVIIVRKLGVPFQPELGMGAIGEDGVRVLNDEILAAAGVTPAELAAVEERERSELERRVEQYRRVRARVPLTGRTALVVDDGLATGSTARAACRVARALGAARVVLAVPVAPETTIAAARAATDADEVVCLATPAYFMAIGEWYQDFSQVSDPQVVALLERAATAFDDPPLPRAIAIDEGEHQRDVEIIAKDAALRGRLAVPSGAVGVVVFAHGSGSSRHSARNRYVAGALNRGGLGTLLFDLLTADEELDRVNVFDVELLGERLIGAIDWLRDRRDCEGLPVAVFGASTGAAAALWAAAEPRARIASIVARGGRPDLASSRLGDVSAPTLLIVGGNDHVVLELNRAAQARMRCEAHLAVVPGASHLFEEPGALDDVARLATRWFLTHFATAADAAELCRNEEGRRHG